MKFIEGVNRFQKTIFPDVLDDYIITENPVRVIDAFVDSLDLNDLGFLSETKETGRPPYDPRDMLKLYIYGYFNKIRSSRKLETETQRNIELMWLLNKLTPDHKTISEFRKKYNKLLKSVFREFVKICKKLNLYGKELAAIDGSKFKAVNSLEKNFNEKKLEDRIKRIDDKIEQYLSELNQNDEAESDNPKLTKEEIEAAISELATKKQDYQYMRNQLEETGQTQISITDADSKRMKQSNGASGMSYNIQNAVDDKYNLIVDYEVTNNCNDKNLLAQMAESAKEVLGVDTLTVLADTGYFTATDISECLTNGIIPHIANEEGSITMCIPCSEEQVVEPSEYENKGKNVYIKERNIAVCPMGQFLYPKRFSKPRKAAQYANPAACKSCPRRNKCRDYDRKYERKIPESEFSMEYDDKELHLKQITYSADKMLLQKRKMIVEHPFGTIKRSMDSSYCLLKGIEKVTGEFAFTFLAYNLKRAINILGVPKLMRAIMGEYDSIYSKFKSSNFSLYEHCSGVAVF